MFPDLFEATKEYWQQLDDLESRYQQGQLSIEEVDQEVERLMKKLGQKRRESLKFVLASWSNWISAHTEILIGLVGIIIIAYAWMLTTTT